MCSLNHPLDKHDEWIENCKNWNKWSTSSTNASTDKSATNSTKSELTLGNNLKDVMIKSFQCTSEQADKSWSEVVQGLVNYGAQVLGTAYYYFMDYY